jgi:hypothetical protein
LNFGYAALWKSLHNAAYAKFSIMESSELERTPVPAGQRKACIAWFT